MQKAGSFVPVYRAYFVSIDNIFMCICEAYNNLYKIDGLGLNIRACFLGLGDTALNFGLDASFNSMYYWKVIREIATKVNSTKVYTKTIRLPTEFSTGVTLVIFLNYNNSAWTNEYFLNF
jgi:hypothetical protein